jgi:hypothetical protein
VHQAGQIIRWLIAQETPSILAAYSRCGDRFFYELCDRFFTVALGVVKRRQPRHDSQPRQVMGILDSGDDASLKSPVPTGGHFERSEAWW